MTSAILRFHVDSLTPLGHPSLRFNNFCFLQAQQFAIQLLNNTHGDAGFPGVRVAPDRSALDQSLAEIVVHTTAVLQCTNQMTICEPLRQLMDNPEALMVRLRSIEKPVQALLVFTKRL